MACFFTTTLAFGLVKTITKLRRNTSHHAFSFLKNKQRGFHLFMQICSLYSLAKSATLSEKTLYSFH